MTRVLCVDDERPFLEITKRYLEKIGGFEVDLATSVKDAVAILSGSCYDVVVSDYQMPEADGIEFLRMLRDAGNDITFILLTGRGREDVAIDALNSGADFYLQKGIDPRSQFHELANMIRKAERAEQAETDLRASEERYRSLAESSTDFILLLGRGGEVEYANHGLLEAIGAEADQVVGQRPSSVLPPGMGSELESCLSSVLSSGELLTQEPKELEVGGKRMWLTASIIPLNDQKGAVTSVIGIFRDVTGIMHHSEQVVRDLDKVQKYLDASSMLVVVVDPKGTVELVNESGLALLGYEKEELVGRSWMKTVVPEDWRERLADYCHGLVAGAKLGRNEMEYPVVTMDGEVRLLHWNISLQVDEDGVTEAMVCCGEDVTEDKRRDELIRYQAVLMDSVGDPVTATDPELGITYMNSAAEEFYGHTLDEVRGRNIHEVLGTEFVDESHEEVVRRVRESGHHRGRCLQHDREGNTLSVEFSISKIEDGQGRLVGFVGSGKDISADLARDSELNKAKEYAESLVDSTNAIFVVLDNQGVIKLFNQAAEEVTGRSRSEVIGEDWFSKFIPPASRERVRGEFDSLISGHRPVLSEFENAILTSGGEERVVAWRNSLLLVEGELRGVLSFGIDVTDLRLSQERFRLFAENAKDVVLSIVLDPLARIEYISPSVMVVTGRPPEDFYSIPGLIFDIMHPDDRGMLRDVIEAPETIGGPTVIRVFHADGSLRWVELQMTPVTGADGNMFALDAVARDVTERMRYENALRMVNKKLNLLSGITRHDVLNQLSVLVGWLQIAVEEEADPDVLDCLRRCVEAAGTMRAQLEFTGDYKRIGMKRPEWLDVEAVFRRGLEGHPGSDLEVVTDVEGIEVFADTMLESVFFNLVGNTVRHSGGARHIRLGHRLEGDTLLVVFEDDGSGIPPKEKGMIFERGYGKGTGYGLYLAREVLSLTGSDIRETGIEGEGARFEISIPKGNYRLKNH